jgi:hypothetical protein
MISCVHFIYYVNLTSYNLTNDIIYDIILTMHDIMALRSWIKSSIISAYHVLSHNIMCSLHMVYHLRRARHMMATERHTTRSGQNDTKSQTKMVKHLHESQEHTATSYMNLSSTLVAKIFRITPASDSETYVNHVKLTVFGVKDCAPIIAEDHPVYNDCSGHGQNYNRCVLCVSYDSKDVSDAKCVLPPRRSRLGSYSLRRCYRSLRARGYNRRGLS